MATPGELVHAIAEALGVPEPTVVVHDRNLVVAGLRTKGGRGRSAAKITANDAANLLIAVAGSTGYNAAIKDSASTATAFMRLPQYRSEGKARVKKDKNYEKLSIVHRKHVLSEDYEEYYAEKDFKWFLHNTPIERLKSLPAMHSFGEALTELVQEFTEAEIGRFGFLPGQLVQPRIRIQLNGPEPEATIRVSYGQDYELHTYRQDPDPEREVGDLRYSHSFTDGTLLALSQKLTW